MEFRLSGGTYGKCVQVSAMTKHTELRPADLNVPFMSLQRLFAGPADKPCVDSALLPTEIEVRAVAANAHAQPGGQCRNFQRSSKDGVT